LDELNKSLASTSFENKIEPSSDLCKKKNLQTVKEFLKATPVNPDTRISLIEHDYSTSNNLHVNSTRYILHFYQLFLTNALSFL
jgi:hypothetical protein